MFQYKVETSNHVFQLMGLTRFYDQACRIWDLQIEWFLGKEMQVYLETGDHIEATSSPFRP